LDCVVARDVKVAEIAPSDAHDVEFAGVIEIGHAGAEMTFLARLYAPLGK